MQIRLLRDWHGNRVGRLLTVTDGAAEVFIKRGIGAAMTGPDAVSVKKTSIKKSTSKAKKK